MIAVSDRAWKNKKTRHDRDLARMLKASPLLKLMHIEQGPLQWRACLCLEVRSLVDPNRAKEESLPRGAAEVNGLLTVGPTMLDVCYERHHVANPPKPWELVSVPYPEGFYHPNADEMVGGLCLGNPQAGISLEAILHLAYGAVTMNSANAVEWEGLNRRAAGFVREHSDAFPLVETGLTEMPPTDRICTLEEHHDEVIAALLRKGVIQCQ